MHQDQHEYLRWGKACLWGAGLYNLLWGGLVIAFPQLFFRWAGMEPLNHWPIWQCLGMVIGLYGFAYLLAATDYRRHWPIVLVGLVGKIAGPIGFLWSAARGEIPWAFGVMIVTNDLIWWIPFGMLLWDAAKHPGRFVPTSSRDNALTLHQAMALSVDQNGRSLVELSTARPVVILALRHAGCTFCREALADLAAERAAIESAGFQIAVVTMSRGDSLAQLARRYELEGISWISDREQILYRAFELPRGTFAQLFGPRIWRRAWQALMRGHGLGKLDGDGFQLPGILVVSRGQVLKVHRHAHAAERISPARFALESATSVAALTRQTDAML